MLPQALPCRKFTKESRSLRFDWNPLTTDENLPRRHLNQTRRLGYPREQIHQRTFQR